MGLAMAIKSHRRRTWHSDNTLTITVIWLLLVAETLAAAMPLAHWLGSRAALVSPAVGVPTALIAASPDFATLVLRDPWDMSEYSDISQYLNESGQRSLVSNPTVQAGMFSGTSSPDMTTGNAYFFPLFPGYATATFIGKVGHRFPIDAAKYRCLYTAMKVDSGPPTSPSSGPDQFLIFWFSDEWLNSPNSPWGQTGGIALYPEAGAGQPVATWKLFKVDLGAPPSRYGNPWSTAVVTWQGLRIDPTIQAGVTFQVDWVRLTTCTPSLHRVTWTPSTNIKSLWLRPLGTSRYIRVVAASPFGDLVGSSGAYDLDTQGLAPGSYFVGVGTDWSSPPTAESNSPLVINETPIVTFSRPSFTSGADYSTQAGKPWDFSDASDVTALNYFKSTSFGSGLLDMVTSGSLPGGGDPEIHLNMPGPLLDSRPYRYLTFRMATDWAVPWQDVPDGMIVRWIWSIPGMTGSPGSECTLVSHDIPFDIGWQTYTIDLHDPFNGSPEEYNPAPQPGNDCYNAPSNWASSGAIIGLRFDPNENISCVTNASKPWVPCSDFHQQLDWIRLTAMDEVKKGTPFPVQITLNVSLSQLTSSAFYYTTDPAGSPQQNRAAAYAPAPPTPARYSAYLPMVLTGYAPGGSEPGANTMTFHWDTAAVTPGTYFICASLTDPFNQATYCSEAPVMVNP
jgi:hypothetical protein